MVKPETGQANFSEKTIRPGGGWVRRIQIDETFRQFQSRLEAVGKPRLDAFADDQPVDDDLDVVLVLLVERGGVLDVVKGAVDPDPGEAGLLPLGELLPILALAAADDRGEEVEPGAFGQRHRPVDHLRHGLGRDRLAGGGAVGHSDARP